VRGLVVALALSLLAVFSAPVTAQSPNETTFYEGFNIVTYPENFYAGWPIDWQPLGVAAAVYRYDQSAGSWLSWFRLAATGGLPAGFNNFWTMHSGVEYWVFVEEDVAIRWYP
jgi:hypothetical protein